MSSKALDFVGLVTAIRQADAALAEQASRAVNVSLTLRNWFIGYYIAEFELQGADRATYGDKLLTELSGPARPGRQQQRSAPALRLPGLLPRLSPDSADSVRTICPGHRHARCWRKKCGHCPHYLRRCPPPTRKRSSTGFPTAISNNWWNSTTRSSAASTKPKPCAATGRCANSSARSPASITSAAASPPTRPPWPNSPTARRAATRRQIIRDPYVFEFLGLKPREVMSEGHLEDALLDKLQDFLLELGHGFCFEARQKRLLIGGEHFFVDLVFYHRILKCHVLIELKNDAFKHEHLGQLNSYVAYYQKHEMAEGDQPPVGILLCTRKNEELVEYALAGMSNQLFVSRYQVQLPGKEEIAAFLHKAVEELGGGDV
jgi:predicted nuclease of restriction endonuclease-like (RecB) superfamily